MHNKTCAGGQNGVNTLGKTHASGFFVLSQVEEDEKHHQEQDLREYMPTPDNLSLF